MGTCKSCKHFTRMESDFDKQYHGAHAGTCDSEKFIYEGEVPKDGLSYWDYESYSAGFHVGEDFGCIHFEAKP